MALSTRIFIGLGLGILTGLFFGERVAFLKVGGDAFVALLQMTVLPYILVSLIGGLGGLTAKDARRLGRLAGGALGTLWGIALVGVACIQIAYPQWESASFFSTALVREPAPFNFLSQYIPTNLFNALSSNVVPAVVVFAIALGISLISMDPSRKRNLVDICHALTEALAKIAAGIARVAPFGVFAIMANVSGTLPFDEFERLQVYIFSYLIVALVLIFWVLPKLVSICTPVSYRALFGRTRGALITAFATGSVFVVLPLLADRVRDLVKTDGLDREMESTIDVVVPTAMSFPSAGKLLTLSFVLYAGWLSGASIPLPTQPLFLITGLFSFFGSAYVAVPYLLDMFQIPSDTFQLLPVLDNIVSVRFGTLLATMSILTLTILTAAGTAGLLRIPVRKLLAFGGISIVLLVAPLTALRLFFEQVVDREYQDYGILVGMKLENPTESRLFGDSAPAPVARDPNIPRVHEIRDRGFLRVGYFRDALPFAFVNQDGELVGMDIELAHVLAKDLGVRVEFVRLDKTALVAALRDNVVDIVMSGIGVTPSRAVTVGLTQPYMDENLAFLVKDHLREAFSSSEDVRDMTDVRIAVLDDPFYVSGVGRYLPGAEIVRISSPREFFTELHEDVAAMVLGAEAGSAWTLVYPQFSVAVPQPGSIPLPLAFAVKQGELEFLAFLNSWIELKKRGGSASIPAAYSHWILGRNAVEREPRWNVLSNVLGWGESVGEQAPVNQKR